MTSVVFPMMIESKTGITSTTNEMCPCTVAETFKPTTDEVTVAGNKGKIFTTLSATATINGSKVSIDLKLRVEGEVRDANTGALLYKVAREATGHADGDACPDTSGIAHASMTFAGHEDYFDSSGAKTGSGATEGFSGQMRFRADEKASLAGVDLTTTGSAGEPLIRQAAMSAAPAFEKAWRSGLCVAVLVSPDGGDIEKDSITTVTAKVMHKFDGNELDKPVDVSFSGVKSIDPAASRQKPPITLRYTAGPKDGDRGSISFESISNRGIGRKSVTFIVGGGWTLSSEGTLSELLASAAGSPETKASVSINAVRVKAAKDNSLTGAGTITIKGTYRFTLGDFSCTGPIDETIPATVTGTLSGTAANELPVLKVKFHVPTPPSELISLTCTDSPALEVPYPDIGHRYTEVLGELELPAVGVGGKNFNRSVSGTVEYRATANVRVVVGVP
jgi:hypothetical protein